MLGRMLVIDNDAASRFAMKARLGAANHQVVTARDVAEALLTCSGVSAVLLRNSDPLALVREIATLKRRLDVPVIVICDAVQRQAAFRAGAEYVLDRECHDSVLRARLRNWLTRPVEVEPGFAEPAAEFVPPDQIALLTDDAALSSEWRCAVQAATGRRLQILSSRALRERLPAKLAAVVVDGGHSGNGLQHLADLRARLTAEGRGTALALLQRRKLADEETRALEIGATEVLPAILSEAQHRAELAARLGVLLRNGLEEEQRHSNTRLARRLAAVDPLTGLANRRRINVDLSAAAASGAGFSVLMIDIDRFKTINDTHGHAAGDTVLSAVARILADEVGMAGRVGRYGGEEFLVLLSGFDETDAISLAERLRYRVSHCSVPVEGLQGRADLGVSISIGVAASDWDAGGYGRAADEILRQADAALLAAKVAGRNLVMLSRQKRAA
ncbi:MAG: diguanylate cyclase [Paracoccus denitrificans]|uniref:diguanylate cyclase n=1 Tax=Paracoccus denitrificans TaxID=266 RepID=A0A533I873_PARDE|nr:MAG: diguanylate cyclase [Paracoccus denitrificans]